MNPLLLAVTTIFIVAMTFSTLPDSLQQQQSTSNNIQSGSNFNVSNNTGDSVYPAIAASGNNVYVVWQDDYLGQSVSYDRKNYDIFFKRSTDGGKSFENITNLSNNVVLSGRPIITAFDNNVYIVWMEDTLENKQIWFRKSTNNGSTFDQPLHLSSGHRIKDSIIPMAIAAFGNDVYVVWRQLVEDGKTGSVLFKASTDTGNTFGETMEISDNAVYSTSPKIAASNNNVYVVWDVRHSEGEKSNKSEGIFFAQSFNNGITFRNETKLNGNKEFGEPQVAAHSRQVYVAWAGSVYNPQQSMGDIFLTLSFNNGNTFAETIPINTGFMDSENVELAITKGRIDAVWQDRITGNGEIFHKRSLNNEPSFLKAAKNLSGTEGLSECPSIAVSGNTTYVAWEDSTYGNHEIFLKKVVLL
jgi:hypothetical protein